MLSIKINIKNKLHTQKNIDKYNNNIQTYKK